MTFLRDWGIALVLIPACAISWVLLTSHVRADGYRLGHEAGTEEAAVQRAPAMATVYARGYETGATEGVARVLGGYKSGRCRLTSDLPRQRLTGQPAPVQDCVAVSYQGRSGIWIPEYGPTPLPTPEAGG